MGLKRSDFTAPPAGVSRNNALQRGWGAGWPSCQAARWSRIVKGDVSVIVRREVAELVAVLFEITEVLGYDIKPGQTWGAACRAIRGTANPSNHSWALAVDINSLSNPMGPTFKTDIPPRVVAAWWACGWYWGGWYQNRPDAMHFEYVNSPFDVTHDLAKAKAILAELKSPKASSWEKRRNAKPGARDVALWTVGADVSLVQRFLGVKPADGKFGPETRAAVKKYQEMRGLKVDGIVGAKTWRPILKDLGIGPD